MNIFATSSCPVESTKALDDKRVVKMVLESCQSLNTVMIKLGGRGIGYKPIKITHVYYGLKKAMKTMYGLLTTLVHY